MLRNENARFDVFVPEYHTAPFRSSRATESKRTVNMTLGEDLIMGGVSLFRMRILNASVLIIVLSILTLPNAMALATSVTISSPSQVPIGFDGNADFAATAQVTVAGVSQSTLKPQLKGENSGGDHELLVVAIGYANEVSDPSSSPPLSIHGSAASDPDQCLPSSLTGVPSGYAVCFILPFCQPAPNCSVTDQVKFQVHLDGAQARKYGFRVIAFVILQTLEGGNQLDAPVGGPVGSSWNTADFYVDVSTNLPY